MAPQYPSEAEHRRAVHAKVARSLAACLALPSGCFFSGTQRTQGPEVITSSHEERVTTEGPLTLIIEEVPRSAPGLVRGRIVHPKTCQRIEHRDVTRSDHVRGKVGGPLAYLLVGATLTTVGAAVLATAKNRSGTPEEGDESSPRQQAYVGGVLLVLPGAGLTVAGTGGLIAGRPRTVTEGYTQDVPLTEPDFCGEIPAPGVGISLSAPKLGLAASPVAVTGEDGSFELTLLELKERLRVDPGAGPEHGAILEEHGLQFTDRLETGVTLTFEAYAKDEGDPAASHDAQLLSDPHRVTVSLGDWMVQPARVIRRSCQPPSTVADCEAALETLRSDHKAHIEALVLVEDLAQRFKGEVLGTYKGSFKDGMRHGRGTAIYTDGWRYSGPWSEGFYQGKGHLVREEREGRGRFEYRGQFRKGKRSGQGVGLFSSHRYEGEWRNNLPNGKGKRIYANGNVTIGEFFKGDLANGRTVIFQWSTGFVWEGEWNEGMKRGTYRFQNSKHRSPNALYVLAGQLLDEGDPFLAKVLLRHIADKHPSSKAAQRAVDRLASLKERQELETRFAEQLEALEEAEADRARDLNRLGTQQREDARRSCLAGCQGKSHEGLASDYNACVSRCP